MSHNISLPTHRYVYVVPSFVLRDPLRTALIPAMWVGVSVTPVSYTHLTLPTKRIV